MIAARRLRVIFVISGVMLLAVSAYGVLALFEQRATMAELRVKIDEMQRRTLDPATLAAQRQALAAILPETIGLLTGATEEMATARLRETVTRVVTAGQFQVGAAEAQTSRREGPATAVTLRLSMTGPADKALALIRSFETARPGLFFNTLDITAFSSQPTDPERRVSINARLVSYWMPVQELVKKP